MSVKVKFKKLRKDAIVPSYQHEGDSGMDLHSCMDSFSIYPFQRILVKTGLAIEIPPGYEGQVRPRSGQALKYGVTVANSPGTIDSSFRGEIGIILTHQGEVPYIVHPGDRIAQMVIAPVERAEIEVVDELDATERGTGGFGSTGR